MVQDGHLGLQDGRHRYNFEKVSTELLDLQSICLDIKILDTNKYILSTYQYPRPILMEGTQLFY